MRLVASTFVILASTSVTFGEDLLVHRISAAVEKAKFCDFAVDEVRLAEAMKTATVALPTPMAAIDDTQPDIIEPSPVTPGQPVPMPEPEEPAGAQPLSLECDRLLEEFGPGGVVFAGLVSDPRPIAKRNRPPEEPPLVPSKRVKVFRVGPDGKPLPDK